MSIERSHSGISRDPVLSTDRFRSASVAVLSPSSTTLFPHNDANRSPSNPLSTGSMDSSPVSAVEVSTAISSNLSTDHSLPIHSSSNASLSLDSQPARSVSSASLRYSSSVSGDEDIEASTSLETARTSQESSSTTQDTSVNAENRRSVLLKPGAAIVHPDQVDVSGSRAKVLYDYESSDPRILSIHVGDVVDLIWRRKDWFYGINADGEEGLVPSTYVNLIR